jgi:peptidylprolyl isomerase
MRLVSAVLILFLSSFCFAQRIPDKVLQDILKAQDLRDSKSLVVFLLDKRPEVRSRAAFACASVQDTAHISILTGLLAEKNNDVRMGAALALGQLNYVVDSVQRTIISRALLRRLGLEERRPVLARVIEALGKVGDEYSLNVMVASGQAFPTSALKSETALSVGRYAYRGIRSKTAVAFAVEVLKSVRSGEEWKAAYALMRINEPTLLSNHLDDLLSFASHPVPDVRMYIASALGNLVSSVKAANTLLSVVMTDSDWRVRVNAIKAIIKADSVFRLRMMPPFLRTLSDTNEHVSLTAIAGLGDMRLRRSPFNAECRKVLLEIIGDDAKYSRRQKKEAAIALAKMMGDEAYLILADKYRTGKLPPEGYVAALGYTPTRDAMMSLIEYTGNEDVILQREALEALHRMAKLAHEDSALVELAQPIFLSALESKDIVVIATAASALADSIFADERTLRALSGTMRRLKSPEETDAITAIMQALADLRSLEAVAPLESKLNDPDHTVATEAAKALEKITGKSYMHLVKPKSFPSYTNFDWKLLDWIRKNPGVKVRTSRGAFTIRLLPDDAPLTCMNLTTLIKKGFFDSLRFHRVVPNFVVQGGDPRGDGWGGPGHSIRSEFGFERYGRGMVGMASSGKDTEGSQWFVTHCNTPHLDGRYTIVGKVTSGLDVVDKIRAGDRILRITFAE